MPEVTAKQLLDAARKVVLAEMGQNYELSSMIPLDDTEGMWVIHIYDRRVPSVRRKYETLYRHHNILTQIVLQNLSPAAVANLVPTAEEKAVLDSVFGDGLDDLFVERE